MKLPKPKKPTIAKLKKDVWKVFSLYIRQRNADSNGYTNCITCGVRKHFKELQAGHFIPGRRNAILFDERGCHAQCYACNCGWLKGNPRMYDKFMRETYGEEVIKDLERLNYGPPKQFSAEELVGLKEKLKTLLAEK